MALTFDAVMDGLDLSADGVAAEFGDTDPEWLSWDLAVQLLPGLLFVWLVAGGLSGSLLPHHIDPFRLQLPMPGRGEHLTTPPSLLAHSIRRSIVAIPYLTGATVATFGATLSITTNVVQDDSPSTLGAAGGLFYGSALGWILAVIEGPLVGIGTAQVLDGSLPRRKAAAICTAVTTVVGVVPVLVLLEYAPREAPASAHVATITAYLISCSIAGSWLVRWRYRPLTTNDRPPWRPRIRVARPAATPPRARRQDDHP